MRVFLLMIRLTTLLSMVIMLIFFIFMVFGKKLKTLEKRKILIGISVSCLVFFIAVALRVVGSNPSGMCAVAKKIRLPLMVGLDVLAAMLYFCSIRLCDAEDPVIKQKVSQRMQRIGFIIVLLGITLAVTSF